MPSVDTATHYDCLIEENNDPARDPPRLRRYMDKWDGKAFFDQLRVTPESSLLEIGVGTGRLALSVCAKCKTFAGIDLSPKTIARAWENLGGFENVRLINADFLTHRFDQTFDIIYSSLTFLHIEDKQAAIGKASRLLNRGGRFVLSIDKNQSAYLDFSGRRLRLYPDNPQDTRRDIGKAGLELEKSFETEFAVIFAAVKP